MFFFSKHIRQVSCWRNGVAYEIHIDGLDEECKEEVQIIVDFIREISVGKSAFISTHGEKNIINENAILFCEKDPKHSYIYNMQINLEKVNAEDKLFMNLFTNLYIFDRTIEWNDFINFINRENIKKIKTCFKKGNLSAFVFIRDLDGIQMIINENNIVYIKKIFEQLKNKEFLVKMKYGARF